MSVYEQNVAVNAPASEVYALWSNFENFPKFMKHIESIKVEGSRSFWKANVAGQTHEWEASITQDSPGQLIVWSSVQGLSNSGWVKFDPMSDNKTLLTAHIEIDPPYGVIGDVAESAGLGKAFEEDLKADLERFRDTVETKGIEFYNDRGGFSPRTQEVGIAGTPGATTGLPTDQGINPDVPSIGTDLPDRGIDETMYPGIQPAWGTERQA